MVLPTGLSSRTRDHILMPSKTSKLAGVRSAAATAAGATMVVVNVQTYAFFFCFFFEKDELRKFSSYRNSGSPTMPATSRSVISAVP